MNKKWFLMLLLLFLLPASASATKERTPVEKLNTISDEALQMVKYQRYEDAKKLLGYFSDQFLAISESDQVLSMDELKIVSVSHDEAMEAAASTDMNYQERINKLTSFRLVIDALSTSKQPLWTEMKDPVMTSYNQAKEAALKGRPLDFHSDFNSFLSLYQLIYPSIKIDIPAEYIQRVDTRIDYLKELHPNGPASESESQEIVALGSDLQDIFDGIEEDETDPSLWWVIISTGSIIIMTLSYVGWRKYKGDQEIARTRKDKLKD